MTSLVCSGCTHSIDLAPENGLLVVIDDSISLAPLDLRRFFRRHEGGRHEAITKDDAELPDLGPFPCHCLIKRALPHSGINVVSVMLTAAFALIVRRHFNPNRTSDTRFAPAPHGLSCCGKAAFPQRPYTAFLQSLTFS